MSKHIAKATRVIKAPASTLFDAWINADTMSRFMCPIPGGTAKATSEGTVGGSFTVEMVAPDGQSIPHHGVYRTIDRPDKLVFTWNSPYARDTVVTITFKETSEGTEVKLVHESLADEEQAKSHTEGWTVILDILAGVPA